MTNHFKSEREWLKAFATHTSRRREDSRDALQLEYKRLGCAPPARLKLHYSAPIPIQVKTP